jgi:hypothetical protein
VITLENGEIQIGQDVLKLQGPSVGTVTIEPAAGSQSRVLNHTGTVQLSINDLTIANGNVQAGNNSANGGCVWSSGTVFLTRSTVRDCTVAGQTAFGGGVAASGGIILLDSTVSGNKALGSSLGEGGGVFAAGWFSSSYSTLRSNQATFVGGAGIFGFLGSNGNTYVDDSTFDANKADHCAAGVVGTSGPSTFLNSTISGNAATTFAGGLCSEAGLLEVSNSTITLNSSTTESGGLDIYAGSLKLQSSIIAHNGAVGVADLLIRSQATVNGADNLVTSSSGSIPAGVIKLISDPKLGPLQYNGGLTRTHMLLAGSPAIGAGNNNAGLWIDQRGWGYPRMTPGGGGNLTDIGAVQREWIFHGDFDGAP